MSFYLYDHREGDEGFLGDLATTSGYTAFCEWADDLPLEDYGEIIHLREYGWEQEIASLSRQLKKALKENPPSDRFAADVARNLIKLLTKAKIGGSLAVYVNDGANH